MEFTTHLSKFSGDLWGFHIPVPEPVAQHFLQEKNRRVVCTLNDQEEFQCALMPKGDGTYFINVNKAIRKRLRLDLGSEVQVKLRKDESKYGLPMPEEFAELLAMDEEGDTYFHALTPGKQRTLLHIIGSPKTSDTRIRKAIVVVEFLKTNRGKLDFRALQQAFKESNRL